MVFGDPADGKQGSLSPHSSSIFGNIMHIGLMEIHKEYVLVLCLLWIGIWFDTAPDATSVPWDCELPCTPASNSDWSNLVSQIGNCTWQYAWKYIIEGLHGREAYVPISLQFFKLRGGFSTMVLRFFFSFWYASKLWLQSVYCILCNDSKLTWCC